MNKLGSILILLFILFHSGCDENIQDLPLPPADFPDVVINLRLPEYNDLQLNGGHVVIPNAGIRGIIVYRESASKYTAFEINCSFESNSATANIEVDPSGLALVDRSCGSRFDISTGLPISGPARSPLRIYVSNLDGSILTITDESENGQ